MSASASSSKRKRSETESEVTIQLASAASSSQGPVLASFSATRPASDMLFHTYAPEHQADAKAEPDARASILAGEDERLEFTSSNLGGIAVGKGYSCRYLVGVRRKGSSTITLVPAPLHTMARRVKKLKSSELGLNVSPAEQRIIARNALGEAFGTKKAKRQIREAERNKVDVGAMEGVKDFLQDSITGNTEALPTKDTIKAAADADRPIPPHDVTATEPADAYKLSDLISDAEMAALNIGPMLAADDARSAQAHLPFRHSTWLNDRVGALKAQKNNKANRQKLKIVLYIAYLRAFRVSSRGNRSQIAEKLHAPTLIVDSLVSKFTETPRGAVKHQTTPFTEAKLLCWMFALCLHVDDFVVDSTALAKELQMTPAKINELFKALGCKIEVLTAADREKAGLTPGEAAKQKRAILRVPLTFPEVRRGKAKR